MTSPARRKALLLLALALAGGSLAACQVSVAIGAVGGSMAIGLLGWLLLGVGVASTQTACTEDSDPAPDPDADAQVGPCLSMIPPDGTVGPCLSADASVGPCLSPLPPDAHVGPCLDPLPPDANVGPCLSPPAPDAHVGPCLSPPAPDARVGPCLDIEPDAAPASLPPADAGAAPAAPDARSALHRERDAVLDRLLTEGRLPADVAARLTRNRT